MLIKDIIDPDCICILKKDKKEEVLSELVELLYKADKFPDLEKVKDAVFYREKLMSTGIGLGIAVPHIRIEGIKKIIMAVGIKHHGIPDYESIDASLVRVVILIIAGKDQHREYIQLLSQIVKKIKEQGLIERLMLSKTEEDIFKVFKESNG